jgi:hypothetical protein
VVLAVRLWLALNAFPSYPDRVLSRRGEASSLTLKSQAPVQLRIEKFFRRRPCKHSLQTAIVNHPGN